MCFILSSCVMDPYDPRELMLLNKSTDTIYTILSPNDNLNGTEKYNGYQNTNASKDNEINYFEQIAPGEKSAVQNRPKSWDIYFESKKDEDFRLFIISKDSVIKYGWYQIFKKQMYQRKYLFRFPNIEASSENLEITYDKLADSHSE